jgi:hypothetical protein
MPTQNIYDLVDTWNAGATTFTAIKMNVTNTASAVNSLLLDLQVGGTTQFYVSRSTGSAGVGVGGGVNANGTPTNGFVVNAGLGLVGNNAVSVASGAIGMLVRGEQVIVKNTSALSWGDTNTVSTDLFLTRRAAANLRLGAADAAAPVAQTLGVQSVTGVADTAGANFTIAGSQGTGTGAGGSIVFQVAPAGTAGSAQNALVTALTINSARLATFAGNIVVPSDGYIGRTNGSALGGLLFSAANVVSSSYLQASVELFVGSTDTILARDAANTLALRHGANAQTFNIYNTYTSSTSYESGFLSWSGNVFHIGTAKGSGGGTARSLRFWTDTADRWEISTTGHFVAVSDNTYDIGASGSARPRNVYVAGNVNVGSVLNADYIYGAGSGTSIRMNNAGIIQIASGNSDSGFNRLQFGGTTSSFPALKRSSTTLQARLADDSAFAPVQGKLTTETAYTAGDPTTTGYLVIYDSNGTAYKVPAVAL